jgi:hypothetical protein
MWEPASDQWSAITQLLDNHCRYAQEAAATFSSLALLDASERAISLKRLPNAYRNGYEQFAALLHPRSFNGTQQGRLARTITARSMQTTIVEDWLRIGLHDPAKLKDYLANPKHSPNSRMELALRDLATVNDADLLG